MNAVDPGTPAADTLQDWPADALAAVVHDDPYPYYDQLVQRGGLHFDASLGLWLAASAASVMQVMDHADCRVRPPAEAVPAAIADGAAGRIFGALVRMNDGALQRQPKLVLQRALAGVDTEAARQCGARLGRHLWRQGALASWMFDTPVSAMASLIGFPDQQLPALAAWMGQFVACLSPYSSAPQLAQAHLAAQALLDSFKILVRDAARQPQLQPGGAQGGSLLALVIAEAQAAGWDDTHALLANLVGLLSQTYEASAGLIGNSVLALRRQPGQARGAAGDAASLVRQVCRDDPPVQNTRRYLARACDIGGASLREGDVILLVLAAAGRDPAAAGHVYGFGHGVHACPGQALACAIAAGALEALLQMPHDANWLASLRWTYRRSPNARIPMFEQTGEAL